MALVLHAKFAKPSGHSAHGSQQGVLGEGGIIVESDGLAQRRFDPSEHRQHDRNGLGGGFSGRAELRASRGICAHEERALAVCAYK